MNSLFTSSWARNVKPNAEALWDLEVRELLGEARGRPSDPKYGRLMGMQSVKELKGTMTPRYFVTKVLKWLEAEHPGKKFEDITDEDIKQAMDLVAGVSRKLVTRPDVKFSTAKAVAAQEKLKKGTTGYETLNLNLTPDTEFSIEDESPLGLNVYSAVSNGLKYRVTLKDSDGLPVKLGEITPGNVASVVVTEPKNLQKISAPTIPGVTAPGVEREKPVADYPDISGDDFSGPDPEEAAYGEGETDDYIPDVGDEVETSIEQPSEAEAADEGEGETEEKEPGAEEVTTAEDEPEFSASEARKRAKGYWERLKEENPELYKKAWAKRQAALEGDEDIEPEAEKFEKPTKDEADDEGDDTSDEEGEEDYPRSPGEETGVTHKSQAKELRDDSEEDKKKKNKVVKENAGERMWEERQAQIAANEIMDLRRQGLHINWDDIEDEYGVDREIIMRYIVKDRKVVNTSVPEEHKKSSKQIQKEMVEAYRQKVQNRFKTERRYTQGY